LKPVIVIDGIIRFLDELLDPSAFDDYGPNGLQVPGAAEVSVVATGVSAHRELFEAAAQAGAHLVVCHHGLFWNSQPRAITRPLKARLEALFAADMSLAAYHLPLDAHPEVGNNALICRELGFERSESFGAHGGRDIGWVGRSADGIPLAELLERCRRAFGQDPFVWDAGPETVRSVGVLSGGGASSFAEAIALGLDAFLTGEPAEPAMADAREAGVHFIAAGHYATETFGVRRLGELLEEEFGVEHHFVEIRNPI
jgi:dinuclear metal center YbgI/SA1388 family protein